MVQVVELYSVMNEIHDLGSVLHDKRVVNLPPAHDKILELSDKALCRPDITFRNSIFFEQSWKLINELGDWRLLQGWSS
jgi:hypothetical protein